MFYLLLQSNSFLSIFNIKMTKVLKFLQWKKTIISSIVTMTITLLANRNIIDHWLSEYLLAVNALVFGSAAIASVSIPKKTQL